MITEKQIKGLEKALAHGGGTHSLGDLVKQLLAGDAQMWTEGDSVIITEISTYPQRKVVHYWLATGDIAELVMLSDRIVEWAKSQGCDGVTIVGRRGWARVLTSMGWKHSMAVMTREI